MRLPVIAIIVIMFTLWLNMRNRRTTQLDEDMKRAFWEREREANTTRRKSLENLSYIHIPDDIPPATTDALSGDARDAARRVKMLRDEDAKIVNLTGYSNTDLKLEYGVANINDLIQYDAHYTQLATALQECGKALYDAGRFEDAKRTLEFAITTGTDVTATYRLLIDMYRTKLFYDKETSQAKIKALLTVAEGLKSLSRDSVVKLIEEAIAS